MIKPSLISRIFAIMPFLRTLGFIFILFGQVNISLASNATEVKSSSEHLVAIVKKVQEGEDLSLEEIRFLYEVDEEIKIFGYARELIINDMRRARPLSQSLRKFSEREQKEFILSADQGPRDLSELLKEEDSIPYFLILMKEYPEIQDSILKKHPRSGREFAKSILSLRDFSNDIKEKFLLLGTRKNLSTIDMIELFEVITLLSGKEVQGDVEAHLANLLLDHILNEVALREIALQGLFSKNLELENFIKGVLEKLKHHQKRSALALPDAFDETIAMQDRQSRDIPFEEIAETWIKSKDTDVEKKAHFIMSFVGAKKNQYQTYLDRLPKEQREEVLKIIREETSLFLFEKFAKSSDLDDELFNEGTLESFKFQRKHFPTGGNGGAKTFKIGDSEELKTTLTRPFQMQETPVTQLQWSLVMGENLSNFIKEGKDMMIRGEKVRVDPNRPVETVSWEDVQIFIQRLNASQDEYTYRLPTEAEWEFAARGGAKKIKDDFSKADLADALKNGWFRENSGFQTHPVAKLRPNPYGLYDIHGNVWEFTQNWAGGDSPSGGVDPTGPTTGSYRVIRGSSFYGPAYTSRLPKRWNYAPSNRGSARPYYRSDHMGFRLVRELR